MYVCEPIEILKGQVRPPVGSKIKIKNTLTKTWVVYTVVTHDPSDPNSVECNESGRPDEDTGHFALFGNDAENWELVMAVNDAGEK